MRLRRAIVFAKDLARMTEFYRDVLGLAALPERTQSGWVELDAGGATLALHAIPTSIAATIDIGDPPRRRSETPIKLVLEVDDLAATRAALVTRGAVVSEPTAWGSCDVLDPEGNVVQLVGR